MKFYYETEAEIPAEQKDKYYLKDGLWILKDVEGAVPQKIHQTFRDNNSTLIRENDQMKGELKAYKEANVDIAEYQRLTGLRNQLENRELIKLSELDNKVNERTATMQQTHQQELKKREDKITEQANELARVKIEEQVIKQVTQYGVEPWALEDVVRAARDKFKYEEGQVVAYKSDGRGGIEKDYGSKKGGMLTIEEWAEGLPAAKPGYFKPNKGMDHEQQRGGGGGSASAAALLGGKPNPFTKGKEDLTLQGQIKKKDPALAKRLMDEAGVKESRYAVVNQG